MYALPTGKFIKSCFVKVGSNWVSKYSASSIPTLKAHIVPTFPNIAFFISSGNWSINWCVMVRFSLYFLASERIVVKSGVAKFWNSSTWRKKFGKPSFNWCLLSAAVSILGTRRSPKKFEFSSPNFPFAKSTKSIFFWAIISSKLKEDFFCPIIFLIVLSVVILSNFDAKYPIVSPFLLWEVLATSSVQYLLTSGSVTLSRNFFEYPSSIKSLKTSIIVASGSTIAVSITFLIALSKSGPMIPWWFGS